MKRKPALAPPQVPAWFDRKFSSVPVEQFPNVCMRLRGTPARLKEMLRGVSRDVLIRKPDGKWSAQENAIHPRLKQPMRLVDHLYFVAEHDDHHLAKIWEMIRR